MSDSVLIALFLLIVFAPCLVAALGNGLADSEVPEIVWLDKWHRPKRGPRSLGLQAMLPELPVSEDFEIRSFPKGISQRRILVRDGESGVKLTIQQVRAAAIELVKLGGMAAAYEFALIAAAAATAMHHVKNAFAIAAREILEAARSAYEWLDLADAEASDRRPNHAWAEDLSPPAQIPMRYDHLRWRETEDLDHLGLAAAAA
jgi:hypothetical protein